MVAIGRSRGSFVVGCALGVAMAVGGCSSVPEGDPEALAAYEEANDPLEPMNRYLFEVNYAVDELLLKPVAGWYYVALPNPVQDRIRLVLRNVSTPVVLANDLFQGETERAGDTVMRFLINSTFGVLGIFDVATDWGYPYHDEDFGQTLAVHDVGEGAYMMLPVVGPTNPRDLTGRIVDIFLDPLTYVAPTATGIGRAGVSGIDARARNLKTLDEIRKGAVDYYATIRSLYRQHRNDAIRNGEGEEGGVYPGSAAVPTIPDPEELEQTSSVYEAN